MLRKRNRFLRKTLGTVLAVTLVFGSVPTTLFADMKTTVSGNIDGFGIWEASSTDTWEESSTDAKVKADSDYYYWEKDDGTVGIMGYKEKETKVTVPETINGKKVTSLSGAFYDCTNITEVSLPSGIIEIGKSSFEGCSSITNINLPESVTEIGESSFEGCSRLTNINLSGNVEEIGNAAFKDCSSLTNINLPESVTEIENAAFIDCSSLTEMIIPQNVVRIGTSVFKGCNNLTKIEVAKENKNYTSSENVLYNKEKTELVLCLETKTGKFEIPEGVKKININAFDNCNQLTEIIIPASTTEVTEKYPFEYPAFLYCNALTRIEVEEENPNYASLDGALYNKEKTELIMCPRGKKGEFEIPEGVEKIGFYSFYYCDDLTEISIPKSLVDIGFGNPFDNCGGLQKIEIAETNDNYISLDGAVYNKIGTELLGCPRGKTGKFEIPEGVTEIGYRAFCDCDSLTEINIPEGVTKIESEAFENCSSLAEINIPEGVTEIESKAFENCNSLVEINIPESMTSIGYGVFRQCSNLTQFSISKCTAWISDDLFYGCHNLSGIEVAEANENYVSLDGVLYNKERTELIICPAGKTGKLEIPEGVEKIGFNGFYGCTNLMQINIPESVVEIGRSAFSNCSGLTEIKLPKGITKIEDKTFSGCTNLETVEISNSVKEFGNSAFQDCSSLKGINIPEGMTEIRSSVFSGCSSLIEISIPKSVTEIWGSAFQDCSNLRTIIIPNGITEIGYAVFSGCSSLAEISIPESVIELGNSAFENCSSLTEISIPANAVIIRDMVFKNCEKLTIKGKKGSCAENYAKNYSIPFIYTTTISSDDGISISYSYTNDNTSELLLQTKLLEEEDPAYQKIDLSDKIADENVSLEDVVFQAYDITLTDESQNIVQPEGSVTVKIPVPEGYQGENCKVYHVNNNGKMANMKAVYSNNYLTFQTDHFSTYLITETELIEQNIIYGDANGDGKVDTKDAVLLKKHLAGFDGLTFDREAADVNADGEVDSKDAVRLLRYLAGYDVILGK